MKRRCMSVGEMLAAGMAQRADGFWTTGKHGRYSPHVGHSSDDSPEGRMSAPPGTLSAAAADALGFHVAAPPSEWPALESAALVVVVGDRQRPGARKLLRRFIGRSALRRVLAELSGRFVVLTCGHGGVSVTEARDIADLIEINRDVLTLSRLVRGHVEVFHAIDAQTRAAIIEAGKAHALRMAPVGGRA